MAAAMRIFVCEKCGAEIQIRSDFAHNTYYNHKKSCSKK